MVNGNENGHIFVSHFHVAQTLLPTANYFNSHKQTIKSDVRIEFHHIAERISNSSNLRTF